MLQSYVFMKKVKAPQKIMQGGKKVKSTLVHNYSSVDFIFVYFIVHILLHLKLYRNIEFYFHHLKLYRNIDFR
jgi:hypothetical protein